MLYETMRRKRDIEESKTIIDLDVLTYLVANKTETLHTVWAGETGDLKTGERRGRNSCII